MRRGVSRLSWWFVLTIACGGDETEAGTNGGSSSSSGDPSTGPSPTTESSGASVDTSGSPASSSESSSSESSSGEASSSGSSSDESTGSSSESTGSSSESGSDTSAATQPTTASSSESSSTGETDTDGEEPLYCLQTCVAAADCCPDFIEDCPGEYPWNVMCTDGLCEYGGCTGDDDCSFVVGLTCEDLGDVFACVPLCDSDDDCFEDAGETCSGATEDGLSYCTVPFVCTSDDDCQGFGVCDLDTGDCVCDDDVCPEGYECAPLP